MAISRSITNKLKNKDGEVSVISVSSDVENIIMQSLIKN